MVYVIVVLQWFKDVIGKVGYQQVLYGFFVQIVVNMVNLIFVEVLLQVFVQVLGRFYIVIKRFFNDQFLEIIFFFVQVFLGQVFWDFGIQVGWY